MFSAHPSIRRIQEWRVGRDALLKQIEKGKALVKPGGGGAEVHQPAEDAFVMAILAPSGAPTFERQTSYIPVSSPVHAAVAASMQPVDPVCLIGSPPAEGPEETIFI